MSGRLGYREGLHEDLVKRSFAPGPWTEEPDWALWVHEPTGLQCAVRRNLNSGTWCGYVVIDKEHPLNGGRYDEDAETGEWYRLDLTMGEPVQLDVHGGVTWHGAFGEIGGIDSGLCVGFDCNHYLDARPQKTWETDEEYCAEIGEYRTMEYAMQQTEHLAQQIFDYAPLYELSKGAAK